MTGPAAITVSSAMRPVRALVFVPTPEGIPWQASFLGALRAQTCVWGGQSNLPVPLDDATFDHPALWRIAECLNPDAIVFHPGSWADLEDVLPGRFQAELDSVREALVQGGHGTSAIERFLKDVPEQPLTRRLLTDDEQQALIDRVTPLHHGIHISSSISGAAHGAGYPFVDALQLDDEWRPEVVREVRCPISFDAELAIAADTGQLSPTKKRELESQGVTVAEPEVIESEWGLSSYVHRVTRTHEKTPPFAIADAGLTWYSQGIDEDVSIRVLAGNSPWDFALFYALRRLTSVAFWVPANRADDPLWISEIVRLPDRLGRGRATRIHVSSVSDPGLADALASRIQNTEPSARVDALAWQDLIPALPRRHICTGSVSLPQSLALEPSGDRSGFFVTPVRTVRGKRDPFGMHWMTEVFIDGWTAMAHPSLGPSIVDAPGYSTYNARTSSDGIAYLSPRPLVTPSEPLEGQVVRPRLSPIGVEAQVRLALARRGWRCELSDKGIYREQSAERFGGLAGLIGVVRDAPWHAALLALTSPKQTGHPGRWLKNEARRTFVLHELLELFEREGLDALPVDLVRRGILHRGLVHKCSRCRWEGWFGQDELGGTLRCGRCRKVLELDEPGWRGQGEPTWHYRLDEVIWQFVTHRGQVGLRAAHEFLWSERPVTLIGPELDLYRPRRKTPVEIDVCVIRGSDLWLGEAKTTPRLGTNEQDARSKLERLRDAAIALDAAGVLLVSEPGFNAEARAVIESVFAPEDRPRVWVRQSPAPSAN